MRLAWQIDDVFPRRGDLATACKPGRSENEDERHNNPEADLLTARGKRQLGSAERNAGLIIAGGIVRVGIVFTIREKSEGAFHDRSAGTRDGQDVASVVKM